MMKSNMPASSDVLKPNLSCVALIASRRLNAGLASRVLTAFQSLNFLPQPRILCLQFFDLATRIDVPARDRVCNRRQPQGDDKKKHAAKNPSENWKPGYSRLFDH